MAALSRLRIAAQPLRRLFLRNRDYGSAAAVQLDYDYYLDEDDKSHGKGNRSGMEESEDCISERGVQWVIIGDPMAKRHVYAERLSKLLGVPHISMGTLVRQELHPHSSLYKQWVIIGDPMAKRHVYAERLSKLLGVPHISMGTLVRQELHPHSSLYKQIASAVNQGKLVPEEVVFGLLSKRLEEGYSKGESGFILDGIPRTRVQAEILDQITDVDLVLNLKSTRDFLMKGDLATGFYSPSREFFRMGRSRFNLSLQSQDGYLKSSCFNIDSFWKEKLRQYEEQSKPLEEYYKKQKKLLEFTVSGATGETWRGLLAALHLEHMNVVGTSQKLSA